jgi:hypothetical protein
VPNEIVIEAMIKGLRPGPTTQYFARKPPQTLEKLLQKMDEYIRADNDFRQRREESYRYSEMTRGFGGRFHPRHVRTIPNPSTNDDSENHTQGSQQSSQSLGMQQTSYRPAVPRGRGGEALEEGLALNPGDCSTYSMGRIRDTQQGHAKSRSKSRRRSLKPKHSRISRSRSCILPHAICHISLNMWATSNPRHRLLRQVILMLLGLSYHHHHHHWRLTWFIISSQKGIARRNNNMTLGRSPKLAQSMSLCPNQDTFTKAAQGLHFNAAFFCLYIPLPKYKYKEV